MALDAADGIITLCASMYDLYDAVATNPQRVKALHDRCVRFGPFIEQIRARLAAHPGGEREDRALEELLGRFRDTIGEVKAWLLTYGSRRAVVAFFMALRDNERINEFHEALSRLTGDLTLAVSTIAGGDVQHVAADAEAGAGAAIDQRMDSLLMALQRYRATEKLELEAATLQQLAELTHEPLEGLANDLATVEAELRVYGDAMAAGSERVYEKLLSVERDLNDRLLSRYTQALSAGGAEFWGRFFPDDRVVGFADWCLAFERHFLDGQRLPEGMRLALRERLDSDASGQVSNLAFDTFAQRDLQDPDFVAALKAQLAAHSAEALEEQRRWLQQVSPPPPPPPPGAPGAPTEGNTWCEWQTAREASTQGGGQGTEALQAAARRAVRTCLLHFAPETPEPVVLAQRSADGGREAAVAHPSWASDTSVSRRHFHIEYLEPHYWLSDLGSKFGTAVRVAPGVRVALRRGAVLGVGDHAVEVAEAVFPGALPTEHLPRPYDDVRDFAAPAPASAPAQAAQVGGDPRLVLAVAGPKGSPLLRVAPFEMARGAAVVGAAPQCDFVLAGADGARVDKRISGRHCHVEFAPEDGVFWLSDAGSTNGTFVLLPQGCKAVRIADGTEFRVGRETYVTVQMS